MNVFIDYIKRRILVLYLMLQGVTFHRLVNLIVSFISMMLKRPTSGRVPPELIIKITSRCNYSCIMCPKSSSTLSYYSHPVDIDYGQLEKLLTRNAKYISSVKLFGGKQLYHQKIIQIIELLDNLNLKYTITTNAYLLTPEIFAKKLQKIVSGYVYR